MASECRAGGASGAEKAPRVLQRAALYLNVTRADMIRAGYSPSVRLFEAPRAAPIISEMAG
jgi:spore maturation protein CgeB